jgi:hypothetical protein
MTTSLSNHIQHGVAMSAFALTLGIPASAGTTQHCGRVAGTTFGFVSVNIA